MYDAAQESFRKSEGKFVLVMDKAIHRGITGVLATRMVKHFKTPVCVVAALEKKAVGSLRSVKEYPLQPFLAGCKDLFSDFGGHDMAAGFSLPLNRLDAFTVRFYDLVRSLKPPVEKEEHLLVDAEIPRRLLEPSLIDTVIRLAPYGEAHPSLLFYTNELVIDSCEIVGKREQVHLKMTLNTGTYRFPAMLWNGIEIYGDRFRVGEKVDIVYRIQKNRYMNTETVQLIITDIVRCGERVLGVIRPDEDFFDSSGVVDY
jgi:single-stranded-DNA-specific exonuclease